MVAAGRSGQPVAAPVVDHIVPVTVLNRQALPFVERMVGAGTASIASIVSVRAVLIIAVVPPTVVAVAAIRLTIGFLILALRLLVAAAIVAVPVIAVPVALREGQASGGEDHGDDSDDARND
jgi:hypothetical protein